MRVLHERMDEVEQYNRSNIIEIQGVPRQPAEDVLGLVKILGRALDYEITDGMIDNCHRMGGGKSEGAAIIVKFVRKLDKEALLQRRRSRREFSARHLGFPGDGPVYLNESFCPRKRRLFALVRQMKAELGYKYLWVRGSQIYVRKHDQSPALVLKTLEDLKNL
ncbi:hypothetical protein AAG570_011379 [Ranatra chinensis]|uniref:FP protein C-terminal domain-containing protein n=1 Tax=Ranatra chinensis TaxID=642074 RepID=A0ABD0YKS1_9HEMI